jgi:hypothetical protein
LKKKPYILNVIIFLIPLIVLCQKSYIKGVVLASKLSFDISQKIQTDMTYPGQVKVTVIRETRAVNIAK